MEKIDFVKKYLEPLLKASEPNIDSVDYSAGTHSETVHIKFKNGHQRNVSVIFDSLTTLAADVLGAF